MTANVYRRVMAERKPYSTDIMDEGWAFVVPYLMLIAEHAP
jgi:hypothetical protein